MTEFHLKKHCERLLELRSKLIHKLSDSTLSLKCRMEYIDRIRTIEEKLSTNNYPVSSKFSIYDLMNISIPPSKFLITADNSDHIPNKRLTKPNKLVSLRFLLPKAYREEFIGDLVEMCYILKAEGHSNWWIKLLMLVQILSVVWHGIFFKLKEIFPSNKKEIEK